MNIFEMSVLAAWLGSGVAGAVYLGHRFGIVGIPLGFVAGLGIAYSTYKLFYFLIDLWIPEFPKCYCGTSGKENYRFAEWQADENGETVGGIYMCQQCSRRYLKTQRHFQEVTPDGSSYPYMAHVPLGRWRFEKKATQPERMA